MHLNVCSCTVNAMRKNKRQLIIAAASCLMIGAMAFGSTMAYLTDTEGATNTFTVGKVQIDLEEPGYPGNNSDTVKNLVPNQEVTKDPVVENTGVNDAIVFMTVEVPNEEVTVVKADGTKGQKALTDLFWFKDSADAQGTFANNWNTKWTELPDKETAATAGAKTHKYVFAYSEKVAKDAKTEALFDKVQLKNVIEKEIDASTQNIVINAYAIQASEVLEGESTDLTDTLDAATLGKIYDIYFKQNGAANANAVAKEAATNNAKDLAGKNLAGKSN